MLKVEIIAIGNEVLRGFITNTNTVYLAKYLTTEGFNVTHHEVVCDEPESIKEIVQAAMEKNDIVITTGGLGPTGDDLTRHAIAEIFESGFTLNEAVAEDLRKRFHDIPISLENQATIPTKSIPWLNPIGTAPALLFDEGKCKLILLPGVPVEMHAHFETNVLPYLRQLRTRKEKRYFKTLQLIKISESKVDPILMEIINKCPQVNYGIYPSIGLLTVQFSTISEDEIEADKLLTPCVNEVLEHFKSNHLQSPLGNVESAIQHYFIEKGLKLSIAESCTGGAVSARVTKIPGASHYFIGGVVTYSNEMKIKILGVNPQDIEKYGAVSEQVVCQMAANVLKLTGSDYSLAVSGVAGPTGGSQEKPVGMVWCAIGQKEKDPIAWKIQARGDRNMIIEWSCASLLNELYLILRI